MAKILDKILPSPEHRTVALRQKMDWAKIECDVLPQSYEEIKAKKIAVFDAKAKKRLKKAAFKACNKAEYADALMESKLQSYDVKTYLLHRAANHGAARKIFKSIKLGEGWTEALTELNAKNESILSKRQDYVAKLEAKKQSFLQKNNGADDSEYKALTQSLEDKKAAYVANIEGKHAQIIAKKQAKLNEKASKLAAKIENMKAGEVAKYSLPEDVLLSARGLKMYFGGIKAVDDLSFDVKKGEIFGLIGPNGAGKTTVFNCITQFYKPTAGQLLFTTKNGETISLTDYKVHDVILHGIARTFQNLEVVKEVTVLDNLLIAATRQYGSGLLTQMLHLPKLKREERIITARADKILKYMDLAAYRNRLCWGLPYGILKRVEIARALMCNPQLVILDEPAAGLNESETRDLAALINRIRVDFDCTILLVEHDMSLVMSICDHICAISFGKMLAMGTAAEVQASKDVQEAYLGAGEDE